MSRPNPDLLKIKNLKIVDFKLHSIGIDFMGYEFSSDAELSAHHIKPRNKGGKDIYENIVVLNRNSSHDYLHIIESIDRDYFRAITERLKRENELGRIDMGIIKEIDAILLEFEKKHAEDSFKTGDLILRDRYQKRLVRKQSLLIY